MGSQVHFISIDPGKKYVGVSFWNADRDFLYAAEVSPDGLTKRLRRQRPKIIVVEEYALYPGQRGKSQTFSRMETPRLIGMIEEAAKEIEAEVVFQGAAVRKIADKSPYAKKHLRRYGRSQSRHAWDAILHALYYFNFGKGEIKRPPRKKPQKKKKQYEKREKHFTKPDAKKHRGKKHQRKRGPKNG